MVDVSKYYSELYEKVSLQLAPLCTEASIAGADPSLDFIIKTRTEGGALHFQGSISSMSGNHQR